MLQLHVQHKSIKRNVIEIIVSYNSYRLVETYNMVYKFVLFASLAAFATAGYIGAPAQLSYAAPPAQIAYASPAYTQYAAPAIAKIATPLLAKTEEYDAHPQYSFGYNIEDALTGDSKNQQESRDGDVVQGSYSLNDADGTRRIVEYTADPINGFNAVVRKEPLVAKTLVAAPAYAKVAAPLAYAAPAYTKLAAPLGYASPLGYSGNLGYGAPLTKYY